MDGEITIRFTDQEMDELRRIADFHGVLVTTWITDTIRTNLYQPVVR